MQLENEVDAEFATVIYLQFPGIWVRQGWVTNTDSKWEAVTASELQLERHHCILFKFFQYQSEVVSNESVNCIPTISSFFILQEYIEIMCTIFSARYHSEQIYNNKISKYIVNSIDIENVLYFKTIFIFSVKNIQWSFSFSYLQWMTKLVTTNNRFMNFFTTVVTTTLNTAIVIRSQRRPLYTYATLYRRIQPTSNHKCSTIFALTVVIRYLFEKKLPNIKF